MANQDKEVALVNDPYVFESDFIRVKFQNGLPPEVGINGVRVDDVIDVVMARLTTYQATELACAENEDALKALALAKDAMSRRRQRRMMQGVFNTMQPHADRTEDVEEDFSATGA